MPGNSEDNWVRFTTRTLKLCVKHLSDDGQVHERCVVCENARLKAENEALYNEAAHAMAHGRYLEAELQKQLDNNHAIGKENTRLFKQNALLEAEVERQKALIVECIRMPFGFEWPQKYIDLADPPQPKDGE